MCGGRRGILNLLLKLNSRCLENRLPASLAIAEVARTTAGWPLSSAPLQSTWSVGTRYFPPCSTLVSTEVARHCPTPLLTVLTPASLGAPCSTRQQVEIPVLRDLTTVSLFREATVTSPLPCCGCMRWDDAYTHVFCARRRAAGFVSHMFTHALTVCTHRDDTVRLDYASRFVRVIYSSKYCLNQTRYRDNFPHRIKILFLSSQWYLIHINNKNNPFSRCTKRHSQFGIFSQPMFQ